MNLETKINSTKNYDILVAKCGRSIGLHGELKLIIYTDFVEIFTRGVKLFCDGNILTIDKFDINRMTVKFKELNDINSIKLINSKSLYMSKEDTIKYCNKNDNEYFWFDIIGCAVFDGDILVGSVADIIRMGNINYLIVNVDQNLLTKLNIKTHNFMIPYIDRYILNVDIKIGAINTIDTIYILENS